MTSSKNRQLLGINDYVILQMDDAHRHWLMKFPKPGILPREINEIVNQAVKQAVSTEVE